MRIIIFKTIIVSLSALALVGCGVQEQRNMVDASNDSFEKAPWFDGIAWAWMLDMVDQPSIKPQEAGSNRPLPEFSVPRTGREAHIPATAMRGDALLRDLIPINTTMATDESVERGRKLYETYCAVCHGADGLSNTPIAKKGMPVVPLPTLISGFSDAHLYNKIRYGQPVMPAYGSVIEPEGRWDIVNYMRKQFGN